MKERHIHIHIRIPDARTVGMDAVSAVFECVDNLRGIHRLPGGERLYTKKKNASAPGGVNPADRNLAALEKKVEGAISQAEANTKKTVGKILDFAQEIRRDIDAICERDPAARSRTEVLLLYSGLHALIFYRLSHALYEKKHFFAARMISQGARFLTGIEIHPGAQIGEGLFIDHGSGVVIGETTIIGDNCTLYQGVTLGGTGKESGKRHPTLGDNVMVGCGAKLLGNLTIGDNAKIAAGAVVLSDVPEDATAVGIPARVVRRAGERVRDEFDQTHIPDPVSQQFCKISVKLETLEKEIRALENATQDSEKTEEDK